MRTRFTLVTATLALLALSLAASRAMRADIEVRLSVKFIRDWDGNWPGPAPTNNTDISTNQTFDAEVAHGNQVLRATGRGYRLRVVEYEPVRPSIPPGQSSQYWFNLDARTNRATIETAALQDPVTWKWNPNAINIYVNNTSSGQCSLLASGGNAITLGAAIEGGTVVHEVGHFFNLLHTHVGDQDCDTNPPPVLGDGDGLAATVPDFHCFDTREALLAALPPELQAAVDTSWRNVMSYHKAEQLLDDQMDIWTSFANVSRLYACSGRTRFVAPDGWDDQEGLLSFAPLATLIRALSLVATPGDVILLRTGTYETTPLGMITTPCTLRATRGPVTIVRP